MIPDYEDDIQSCLRAFKQHGVILYPTDTIWGLGCDAQDEEAIEKIYRIKQRDKEKNFILLMTDFRQLSRYLASPWPELESLVSSFENPTTIIYPDAVDLPDKLMSSDRSIAVRITRDPFCRSLIKRMRSPLVSTSANLSGQAAAATFNRIDPLIRSQVDYSVSWRQDENKEAQPSAILKVNKDGSFIKIR